VGSTTWIFASGSIRESGVEGNLHEITITGLSPQTSYEYRLARTSTQYSGVYVTSTAPLSGPSVKSSFDFIFVADSGLIGRTDGLATGTAQVIDEIAAQNADFILFGGDYAYFNTEKDRFPTQDLAMDEWFRQWEPVNRQSPVMPTYGNHELYLLVR